MRPILITCFVASGASGLIYEVVWTRQLGHVFGSDVIAAATVLAVFMAGLALGSRLAGSLARRAARPLAWYGWIELGIGCWGAAMPLLLAAAEHGYFAFSVDLGALGVGRGALRMGLSACLFLAPTALMGATFPLMVVGLARQGPTFGRWLGDIYAFNTLGGVMGAVGAGFALIPALGLMRTGWVAAGLNVAVGLVALVVARRLPLQGDFVAPTPARPSEVPSAALRRAALTCATLSGLAALGYEVVWARALVFIVGNSTFAFTTMLAAFLVGISLGGAVGGRLADAVRRPELPLALVETAAGLLALATLPLIWHFDAGDQPWTRPEVGWASGLVALVLRSAAVMLAPSLLLGMAFPLTAALVARSERDVGPGVGTAYAANTVGAILGALLAGFALIPALGLGRSVMALAAVNIIAAIVVLGVSDRLAAGWRAGGSAACCAIALAVGWLLPPVRPFPVDLAPPGSRTLFYREGVGATVHVVAGGQGVRMMAVDGHAIGGVRFGVDEKERLLAHLPYLIGGPHPRALTIGLGSGITAGAMAFHPGTEILDVVEIVPGVVEGARFFDRANRGILDDPRARIFITDGVAWLRSQREAYDLIVSDAKLNPRYFGNTTFFGREYYELCRDHLAPEGLFIQWVPNYVPEAEFRMILRTFAAAFDEVSAWNSGLGTCLLVGSVSPQTIDYAGLVRRGTEPDFLPVLWDLLAEDPATLLGSYCGDRDAIVQAVGPGPLNTWDHPIIEFDALRHALEMPRNLRQARNLTLMVSLGGDVLSSVRFDGWPDSMAARDAIGAAMAASRVFLTGMVKALEAGTMRAGIDEFTRAVALNPRYRRAQFTLQNAVKGAP